MDSSVWIDHFRGAATPQVQALIGLLDALHPDSGAPEPTAILLGDLVLAEVLRGVSDDRQHRRIRAGLLALPQVTVGGTEIALAAVDHYRALRRLGVTVRKTVDCLIAAWCIARRAAAAQRPRLRAFRRPPRVASVRFRVKSVIASGSGNRCQHS